MSKVGRKFGDLGSLRVDCDQAEWLNVVVAAMLAPSFGRKITDGESDLPERKK